MMKKALLILLVVFSFSFLFSCDGGFIPSPDDVDEEYYKTTLEEILTVAKEIGFEGTVEELLAKFPAIPSNGTGEWYTGTTLPLATEGNKGDGFLHSKNFDIYLKGDLQWTKIGNLKDAIPTSLKVTVTFSPSMGISYDPITLDIGECTELPTPKLEGMKFDGWYYMSPNGKVKITSETPIISDITLVATWTYCVHSDKNSDGICDDCEAAYCKNHTDKNFDKKCDICAKDYIANCVDHTDNDSNNKCDYCGASIKKPCTAHADANNDLFCDYCGSPVKKPCTAHADDNRDHKCDECGKPFTAPCISHIDVNKDSLCDYCGSQTSIYPWNSTNLIFQMTKNTQRDELSSGCERYLAGESTDTDKIDEMIAKRNAECKYFTGIDVTYLYWPDTNEYAWGRSIERIETIVKSGSTKDVPDMYCNFVYDMVGASLKGCFANLYSTARGAGDLNGLNYFSFIDYIDEVNEGYMYDYMRSTSLSRHKMYILASDYFIDMIRAFFCIPVNIRLIESTGARVAGNSGYNLDDFYQVVKDGDWTYDTLATYAAAAHVDDGVSDTAQWLGDEVLGFAMSSGGLAVSGMIYSQPVDIVHRMWDDTTNDWSYYYPDCADSNLDEFCDAISTLMAKPGIVYVRAANTPGMTEWGQNEPLAIRTRFTQDHVLFGDIIFLGTLEFQQYQEMKEDSGFGVVPVPLYAKYDANGEQLNYRTMIHTLGRPGAIAANTRKFAECTAFLHYQSTHSTDILNEYYDYKFQHETANGNRTGTVEMLQYIRSNVRTAFDKTVEDAINRFYGEVSSTWASIISRENFILDIRGQYKSIVEVKQIYLEKLETYYAELPE